MRRLSPSQVDGLLFLRADVKDGEAVDVGAAPGDGLVGGVDGDARIDVEKDGDLVGCAVGCGDGPGQVGDGAGEQRQVLREGWGEEGEVEVESGGFEDVDGAGCVDLHGDLTHCRNFAWVGAR